MGQVVERNGDVESILELADEFQHLQRVKPEIGEELAVGAWFDRTPTQALQNLGDVADDAVG
jgi:hypothetical protein